MKIRFLIAVLAGTAALTIGISCAPIDPPASEEDKDTLNDPQRQHPEPGSTQPDALKARVDAAIDQVRRRELYTDNGFWTVFHGVLGLGPSLELTNRLTGQHVNALDYIAGGNKLPGLRFIPNASGLDVETGPGTFVSQGHQDQFVAEMVEWGVSPERKFVVDGKDFTFNDFIRYSKAHASVKTPQELEWALVIIGTHYGTDIAWTNAAGEELRYEDLVRAELDKDVNQAACGGTHLLFGLTWAYHLHLSHGGQPTGVWKEVADRIAQYKKQARDQQNSDGTFSTAYFHERASDRDVQLRINTTGHIFEWLALALTDEELKEPWVQNAASALALTFLENQDKGIDGGSMYHAVHGLLIYSSRVYGASKLGGLTPHVPPPPAKNG